jgi:hypothetical protein
MKPIINLNNGDPTARCNRCFIIICYVMFIGDSEEECVIRDVNYDHFDEPCTLAKIGDEVPLYCEKCSKLLKYTLNE